MTMRVILVGLVLALTLQLCIAQQTTPAGLQTLAANTVVWAASWQLPNVSSVSSWDVSGHTLSTSGSAPTLLANKFNSNNPVPGVSFNGSQCLTTTAIGAPSGLAYSVYVVAQLPGVGVHVLAAQEQSTSIGYALILTLNGTAIELGFYADGALVGSVVTESGSYLKGDTMIFWYTQDASYGTIGFDVVYNSFPSASASFTAALTTAIGCNLNGDYFTGVLGEVLILKSGGNNTAAHNIIMNNLAARFEAGIPNVIYTGASEQNSNCDLDVSGIGAEVTTAVLSGNSVQLTLTRQSPFSSSGSYIMFGRPSDDGDLFALPFNVNYTMFSRSWFVTIAVQGQATADVSFDVSSVKDVMAANNGSYLLLYQSPSASGSHDIIAQNGVVSSDNNTVTFAGVTLTTGFITVGSTAPAPQAPKAPQAPTSGPVAGPAAGPASPTPYAYPSPGIVRRSDTTASTVSVLSAVVLAASLMF